MRHLRELWDVVVEAIGGIGLALLIALALLVVFKLGDMIFLGN